MNLEIILSTPLLYYHDLMVEKSEEWSKKWISTIRELIDTEGKIFTIEDIINRLKPKAFVLNIRMTKSIHNILSEFQLEN